MAYAGEEAPLLSSEPRIERRNHDASPSYGADSRAPKGAVVPRSSSPGQSSASSLTSSTLSSSLSSSSSSLDFGDTLRDIIIGFSDGLTVPFALTAGLSSLGSTRLVIMGGLAELFSGMISMGLGAYLAAATERDCYRLSLRHLEDDCDGSSGARDRHCDPVDHRRAAVLDILDKYGVSRSAATPLADELADDPHGWLSFKKDFSLGIEEPQANRAWLSGLTMGLSYFVGGLIPMLPYFLMNRVLDALAVSIVVTVFILIAFGYAKNYLAIRNHRAGVWGAIQTLIIGVLAAGTSYLIVKAIDAGGSK
ncbi:hypothetical protein HIM_02187 [Hirsutella minnesotensis 3608]|nr:hypothetical protein HIM_02187 [Hirsutella minnesotensis 3608]